ncbi:MAG: TonB family protein, partial [Terriglobales bacterium]
MAVTQARHIPSERISSNGGGSADPVIPPQRESNADKQQVLATLRELVAAGEHRLDPMLAAIADAALLLTGASGVAIAMWKDGAMVCRARSGDTAPPLGAQLSADTGISGECLRTGKMQHCVDTEKSRLVDFEVCRTLRLRSIAVLPIQAGREVARVGPGGIRANGILEVFSTEQGAFNGHHLAVLEQLAGFAERARAAKPAGASPLVAPMAVVAPVEKPEPVGLLPASDRFVDFARAVVGRRPLVLGAVGVTTILLLGLVIWLGWRGNDGNESKAHAATISTLSATVRESGTDARPSDQPVAGQHVPDNDRVWKPNPGGQLVSSGKPSAARTVQTAGLGAADAKKHTSNNSSDRSAGATATAARDGSRVEALATSGSGAESGSSLVGAKTKVSDTSSSTSNPTTSSSATSNPATSSPEELAAVGALPPGIGQSSQALNGVLSSKAAVPTLSAQRVSQGVSGGQLIRRVPPIYPPQAKSLRMEGKVVLDATVTEDGSVRDLRVVQGQPVFVEAAVDAVKQWRYKPFVLD